MCDLISKAAVSFAPRRAKPHRRQTGRTPAPVRRIGLKRYHAVILSEKQRDRRGVFAQGNDADGAKAVQVKPHFCLTRSIILFVTAMESPKAES